MQAGRSAADNSSPPTLRVISIIELLAGHDGSLTSAEIADALSLSRSTAGAILSTLDAHGWVRRLPDLSYEVGPVPPQLFRRPYAVQDPAAMHDELGRLAARVGCGAALTRVDRDDLVFVAVVGDQALIPAGIRAGTRIPLLPPAGAAVIAHSAPARQQAWLARGAVERREEFRTVLEILRTTGSCVWGLDSGAISALQVLSEVVSHLIEHPARTDLRGRVLGLLATIGGRAYDRPTLDSDAPLPLSYLSAPVLDRSGNAMLELQIGPLRPSVGRRERQRYLAELTAAARRIGNLPLVASNTVHP